MEDFENPFEESGRMVAIGKIPPESGKLAGMNAPEY